jgi:hypothetical protein
MVLDGILEVQPENVEILDVVIGIYHDGLMNFPKAYDYAVRADNAAHDNSTKLNLAEADLTTSRFASCLDAVISVDVARLETREVPGRLVLLLACQWGAGQHDAAAKTSEAFAAEVSNSARFGWDSAGDCVYLATSPQFQADRELWTRLFVSLQQGNATALVEAATALGQRARN